MIVRYYVTVIGQTRYPSDEDEDEIREFFAYKFGVNDGDIEIVSEEEED